MKLWLCIYCFAHIYLIVPDLNSSNITLYFPETNTSLFKVLLNSFFFTRNSAIFYPPMVWDFFSLSYITGKFHYWVRIDNEKQKSLKSVKDGLIHNLQIVLSHRSIWNFVSNHLLILYSMEQLYCVVLVASLSQKDNRNSVSKFQYFCSLTLPKFKEQELSHLRCRFSHLYYLLIAGKKSLSTRIISDLKQKWQITSQYHSLLCAVFPQNQGAFIHCIRCVLWYSVLFYSASPLALKLNAVFVWIQNDLRSSRKVRKWQYPNMKVWLISRLSALYSHSCTGEK